MRPIFVLLVLFVVDALACTCDFYIGDIDKDFEEAAMVFRATVVTVDYIPYADTNKDGTWTRTTLVRAEVDIKSTFKGDTSDIIYVVTDLSDCGLKITKGDDYIFFTSVLSRVHLHVLELRA